MEDTRKGILTESQEKDFDDAFELDGIAEMGDGIAIKLIDNIGLEAAKKEAVEKWGIDILPDIYNVVDMLVAPISAIAEKNRNKKE